MAIRIKIVGYAGTCLNFAAEFLEIFRECVTPGTFTQEMIENVIQEKQQEMMDYNAEVGDKAASNRIAFLNPFSFHPTLIANALE